MNNQRTYENLTVEEKADYIARLLNFGLVDYFDTCVKGEDGRYVYVQAQTEQTYVMTARELVESCEEEWTAAFFAENYEED